MNELMVFDYFGHNVRVVLDENGEPWWVAKDVCDVLGLSDVSMSLQSLEEDEKLIQTLLVSGQNRQIWTINEPGLYTLIIRSNKPEAKKFKRWITHDVLPSIRKQGYYAIPKHTNPSFESMGGLPKRSDNIHYSVAELCRGADKYLDGKASLMALNYFTGMPVDELIREIESKRRIELNPGTLKEVDMIDYFLHAVLAGDFSVKGIKSGRDTSGRKAFVCLTTTLIDVCEELGGKNGLPQWTLSPSQFAARLVKYKEELLEIGWERQPEKIVKGARYYRYTFNTEE